MTEPLGFFSEQFEELCKNVLECQLCIRMKDSQRVLSRSSGPINSRIMFVGEAPGRLGADETGIPFHGDKAGYNFEELLLFSGINRSEVFVTNAVLCNPRDDKGNNSPPAKEEIRNCSNFLKRQIDTINPQVVVALGSIALLATNFLEKHNLSLKENVRTSNNWYNRILIPLYHPGQRAMLHRSFANQRSDYQFVAEVFKRLNTKRKSPAKYRKVNTDIASIVKYILRRKEAVSYFALHKLFYLIEYQSYLNLGNRLTDAYIVRQKDGPYCTDLHLFRLKKTIDSIIIKSVKGASILTTNNFSNELFLISDDSTKIPEESKQIIDYIIEKYGNKSNIELKRIVYLTQPMREMLRIESEMKINLYNSPISFEVFK